MANKNFYVHNGLTVGGLTIDATTSTLVTGGLLITTSTTAATTVTSGALQVRGGAGIVGDLYVGGNIFDGGYQVLNTNNIGSFAVTGVYAGTNTQVVSSGTGVIINDTNTLQSVTDRGAITTNDIKITDVTQSTSTSTGALTVAGGVGIGGALNVGGGLNVTGVATFTNNVVFQGTTTYVFSTNTVYTDNILQLHNPVNSSTWTVDDGKDIGFKFHYYTSSGDQNGALVLANDTKYLEWYSAGAEGTSTFAGSSYGVFKTGAIILASNTNATSTITGAFQVVGGAGIGGSVYIGGNLNVAGTINATINGVTSTATNLASGTANQIPYQVQAGQTSYFGPGSTGQLLVSNGTTAGGPVFTNTGSIYVGFAGAVATQQFSNNANYYLGVYSTSGAALQTPGTDIDLYYNPSLNTLYAGTFNGSHSGSGANLTSIPNSALVNSSITVNAGNTGIGISGSPVSLGGVFTVTNLGVTQFLGGTTGLTSTNTTGTVTLTGTLGVANGGTNATGIGPAGTIAISNGVRYAFNSSGTTGQVLTQGVNTVTWTAQSSIAAGTADDLTGGQAGWIPIQAGPGVTSFIQSGTSGYVLTMGTNTATWQAVTGLSGVAEATTATNIKGGVTGQIPYQTTSGITTFLGTGTVGSILQTAANGTPTWIASSSITVGSATTANEIAGGTAGALVYQIGAGSTDFIGIGAAGTLLQSNGTTATYVTQSTLSVGTATNIGLGAAGNIPYQTAAGATSFVANGTSGQVLSSNGSSAPTYLAQSALSVGTSTNIAGGNSGLIPIQLASGTTRFIASGTNGQILVMGVNTATWTNGSSITVGTANQANLATTATNLAGAAAGSIPIQTAAGLTSFIPIGSAGYVLTANGTTATWSPMSGVSAGLATTATNLAGGTAGQVPYQTAAGATSFYGPGTAGQILVSGGTTAPVYQSTLTLASTIASTNTTTGALVVAGGVGVGGNLNVQGNVVINSTGSGFVQNDVGIAVGVGPTNLDTFSTSTYRSAKYIISVENNWNNTFQTTEALVIHNGITAYIQEASVFTTATPIMDFDAVITSGIVQLQGTASFNTNTVKIQRFYIVN